jgi:TM2 domain-containing membrane protein YozV
MRPTKWPAHNGSMPSSPNRQSPAQTKNKTVAAWLAFVLGQFGAHRFYLFGFGDLLAWLHPLIASVGWVGVARVRSYGQDDQLAWLLVPVLGFLLAACALTAIVYGLMPAEKWNARYSDAPGHPAAGQTNWLTMGAVVFALLFGTIALMSSIAFSFQRFFEYQVEEAKKLSQ